MRGVVVVAAVAAGGLLWLPEAAAEVVVLGASHDNTLYESETGSLSNGAGPQFFAGANDQGRLRRGLISFDVAGAIPAGSVVTGAVLTLHMSRTATATEVVLLHRTLAGWGESGSVAFGEGGGGGSAAPGDATWLHTYFNDQFWSTPGGDFASEASAEAAVSGIGSYTWGSTAGLVADVQMWLDQPSLSFGWTVLGNEEFATTAKRFDSREHADPLVRPSLVVQYTPVPAPGGALVWVLTGLGFQGSRRRRER